MYPLKRVFMVIDGNGECPGVGAGSKPPPHPGDNQISLENKLLSVQTNHFASQNNW